jgi:hypothetical protein
MPIGELVANLNKEINDLKTRNIELERKIELAGRPARDLTLELARRIRRRLGL